MPSELDARTRAARVGAALYVAGSLIVLATMWMLPSSVDRSRLGALCALGVAIGLVVPLLPWARWPQGALMTLPLLSFALITIGVHVVDGLTIYYLSLMFVPFVYVGLTQRPGTALVMTPVALVSFGVVALWGAAPASTVNFAIALPLAVLTGEALAQALRAQRKAERGLERLLEANRILGHAADEAEVAASLAVLVDEILGADLLIVLVADEPGSSQFVDRAHRRGIHSHGINARGLQPAGSVRLDADTDTGGAGVALRTGQLVFVPDTSASMLVVGPDLGVDDPVGSGLFVPLPGEDGFVGVLVAMWRARRARLGLADRRTLELLSSEAGRAFERTRAAARLALEAETDPLTNLANRRSYARALSRIQPGDAVVLIDLDDFKQLNDRFGHGAGDEALRRLARRMRHVARQSDCVARYGGDELAMILGRADEPGAIAAVERLQEAWRAAGPSTTFSAGIAVRVTDETPAATLGRADRALYRAKEQGRDQFELAHVEVAVD
jgi:diguanylate cyclase (GGDEF)-like protein